MGTGVCPRCVVGTEWSYVVDRLEEPALYGRCDHLLCCDDPPWAMGHDPSTRPRRLPPTTLQPYPAEPLTVEERSEEISSSSLIFSDVREYVSELFSTQREPI